MNLDKKQEEEFRIAILKHLAGFCEANNIAYFLAYGSLLGAIREKKMIPWDYDIDIMMPRPDFQKFISIYPEFNKVKNYRLQYFSINHKFTSRIAILEDLNTINSTDYTLDENDPLKRISVEIYPIDGVSDIYITYIINLYILKFLNYICKAKTANYDATRSILKNIVIFILACLSKPVGIHSIIKFIHYLSQKHSFNDASYVGTLCIGDKLYVEKSIYNEFIYTYFENSMYRVPKEYDKWLTMRYGAYMKKPSKEAIEHSLKLRNFYNYSSLD